MTVAGRAGPPGPRLAAGLVALALAALPACHPRPRPPPGPAAAVEIQLLALSDFHGRLLPGPGERAPPGAVALAAALEAAALPGRALVVEAGDLFGASGAESGLLREAPTVAAFGCLCRGQPCLAVGGLGNHELDRGWPALRRLLAPEAAPPDPAFLTPWPGAAFPLLAANLLDRRTGATVLPASAVRSLAGVRVGLVGAVTGDLPRLVRASALEGLEVEDPAPAINREVRRLAAEGVGLVVVLLHEGDDEAGTLASIVGRLDPAVAVVVSGHSHAVDERRLPTADPGRAALVVQARPHGRAFHDVRIEVDRSSGRALAARTRLVEVAPRPGPAQGEATRCVAEVVARAAEVAGPRLDRPVGSIPDPAPPTPALVAAAYRAALGTDLGLVNAGGVRVDLAAGPVTHLELQMAQPFGNVLCLVTLDGAALGPLLEGAGQRPGRPALAWAGLEGLRPEPGRRYTIATIDFLLDDRRVPGLGGAPARCDGPLDVDALADFIARGGAAR